MKTVICDVCGRSKSELTKNDIHRFKVATWFDGLNLVDEPKKFDICTQCWMRIQDEMRKNKEE